VSSPVPVQIGDATVHRLPEPERVRVRDVLMDLRRRFGLRALPEANELLRQELVIERKGRRLRPAEIDGQLLAAGWDLNFTDP
jgi:hypothetical protein